MAPGDKWNLAVRCVLWTVSAERAMHHYTRAAKVAEVREAAAREAKRVKLPRLECVRIVATPCQTRHPMADCGNHLGPVKAAIDGLVDAGVLADDNPLFVTFLGFNPPVKWHVMGLTLEITEVVPGDGPLTLPLPDQQAATQRSSTHAH